MHVRVLYSSQIPSQEKSHVGGVCSWTAAAFVVIEIRHRRRHHHRTGCVWSSGLPNNSRMDRKHNVYNCGLGRIGGLASERPSCRIAPSSLPACLPAARCSAHRNARSIYHRVSGKLLGLGIRETSGVHRRENEGHSGTVGRSPRLAGWLIARAD